MIDRVRTWLGLEKLDPAIGERIYDSDARTGAAASVVTLLFEMLMLVAVANDSTARIPAGYDPHQWFVGHAVVYAFLLAALIGLFACSLMRLRGRARTSWPLRIAITVFEVAAYAFGIYISSIDYEQGRLVLVFVCMMVLCSCLFIVLPIVNIVLDTAAFVIFFAIINAATGDASTIVFNLSVFWLVTTMVCIVRYNEKRIAVRAQLDAASLSAHDALTGLKNRRSLADDFEGFGQGNALLVMLDVDDFKFFNDAYGHGVGDQVLAGYAGALASVFPAEDCYRSGGDEFIVMVPDADMADFRAKMHRLRDAVSSIGVAGTEMLVTSSAGAVSGFARGAEDLQNMLSIADIAMYEAKRQGKARIVYKEYDGQRPGATDLSQAPRTLAYKIEESDLLTGLPNYTHFRNRAALMLGDAAQGPGALALVYFDVANFKAFNHEYGYEGGDAYLQSLANVLRDVFKGQLVARFGEDRFVVLADRDRVVERVVDVHERAHSYQRDVPLEVKAGICFPSEGQTDVSVLYDCAKMACDSIKTEFDRVYRIYDNELDSQIERRNHIVNTFDTALREGWIRVYYQPVVRTQTGRICGGEALARWVDPQFGAISPAEFVGVLEQYHLVNQLDLHVIRAVCEDYRTVLGRQSAPVPVSVNLSRLDFELCDIFSEVERVVAETGMERSMLHLEVTESVLTENSELVKQTIRRFRQAGYQVWMDDFGSGYSSFNLLKDFDFDVLKIDMLFLKGLEDNENSRIILSSVVDMAKQLGVQTLCEGVETDDQRAFLAEIGCEKLQGYLFSKPRPLAEIAYLIASGQMAAESMEHRPYFAATGRVNIIGRSYTDGGQGARTDVLPLAVLEYRHGSFHYLSANRGYRELMERLGVGSLENAEHRFNDEYLKPVLAFEDLCRRVKREGGARSIDHITYGVHCNTRVSYVASDGGDADAFLIATISDADLSQSAGEATLQRVLRFVLSVYTRVDVIAEDNALMANVYLGSGQYNGRFEENDVGKSLRDYADNNIHPDDRARFLEYYDMATARPRLAARGSSHLAAVFRTVAAEGGYAWQFYMLVPIEQGGRKLWLSCVRDIDADAYDLLPRASDSLPRA